MSKYILYLYILYMPANKLHDLYDYERRGVCMFNAV